MIRFRTYRNGDSPALVRLWNRALEPVQAVRPLTVHEFDALIMGKLGFDGRGLILAESEPDGQLLGFVHAGFGPRESAGPSHRLDRAMGTVAMLVVEPGHLDPELSRGLLLAGERYLRSAGAEVLYCGGLAPLNPFYWGLYGGSEYAGVLGAHTDFRQAVEVAGYEPVAVNYLYELDLNGPEPRDPRFVLLRRTCRVEIEEDALPHGWWDSLAIGAFRPTRFSLLDKDCGRPLAQAWTWDIAAGCTGDGLARTGLYRLEVEPAHRRKGLGRLLVVEAMRHARSQLTDRFCVQTASTNTPALNLYGSLGFQQVEEATFYRLPAALCPRSLPPKPAV